MTDRCGGEGSNPENICLRAEQRFSRQIIRSRILPKKEISNFRSRNYDPKRLQLPKSNRDLPSQIATAALPQQRQPVNQQQQLHSSLNSRRSNSLPRKQQREFRSAHTRQESHESCQQGNAQAELLAASADAVSSVTAESG